VTKKELFGRPDDTSPHFFFFFFLLLHTLPPPLPTTVWWPAVWWTITRFFLTTTAITTTNNPPPHLSIPSTSIYPITTDIFLSCRHQRLDLDKLRQVGGGSPASCNCQWQFVDKEVCNIQHISARAPSLWEGEPHLHKSWPVFPHWLVDFRYLLRFSTDAQSAVLHTIPEYYNTR
jgi:hypothetical protein